MSGKTVCTGDFADHKCLARGSSGSWVVAGDKLCGHIIAVRENVPWAYMLPVGGIFEDIMRMTGAKEVGLVLPASVQQKPSGSKEAKSPD